MHLEPEFAEEHTKAARFRLAILGVLFNVIGVLLFKTLLFPLFRGFVASAPCSKVFGVEGLTVLWYGIFVGMPMLFAVLVGIFLGVRGYKILRDSQFPPAKEKVFRPTRISRGSKAKLIGYIHLCALLPFLVLAIWGAFQAEEMSKRMQAKSDVCTAHITDENDAYIVESLAPAASRRLSLQGYFS